MSSALALAASPARDSLDAMPLDEESRAWLQALRGDGRERHDAVAALHALLVRASRFELGRRRASLTPSDAEDLAQSAASDALTAVLAKLETYEGRSRFTTWAYKFALYEAAVQVRRHAWRDRELPLDAERWPDPAHEPQHEGETLRALRRAVDDLTAHQRRVFVALALNDVPIDVLADRLHTTRGALYKTLHDARRRLRAALAAEGLALAGEREGGA
jgi:RNA polymerase sigma-70 factor (ECF subfamily)